MPFASAYPSSNLSALQFAMLVIVVFGGLGGWLGLVYLAERPRRKQPRTREITDSPGPRQIATASSPVTPPLPDALTPPERRLEAASGSQSGPTRS
jgi:hypothetical protein